MITFNTPSWSIYEVPSEWIKQINLDLLNSHFILIDGQTEIIRNKVDFIVWIGHDFIIKFIDCFSFAQINP